MTRTTRIKLLITGIAAVSIAGIGLATTAHATPRAGNNLQIGRGEVVNSTLYAGGRQITMDGEVDGDMFCAGQNVTISGRVAGDIICAAQNIHITGQVDGDIRVAAQDVTLSAQVGGSVSVAAQALTVEGGGQIGRDLSVAASDATINGRILRDIAAGADNLTLNGEVGRDVDAHATNVNLGRSAQVAGNVNYTSDNEARHEQGAQVSGTLTRHQPPQNEKQERGSAIGFTLFTSLAMLATAVVLALLMPRWFWRVSGNGLASPGRAVLTGLSASLVAPVLIVTLMLTVIGIPLGLLALLAWVLIVFVSGPVAAFMAGRLLLKNSANTFLVMLAGAALLLVLYLVPVLNVLVVFAAIWFGAGAIILWLWSQRSAPAAVVAPANTGDDTTATAHKLAPRKPKDE